VPGGKRVSGPEKKDRRQVPFIERIKREKMEKKKGGGLDRGLPKRGSATVQRNQQRRDPVWAKRKTFESRRQGENKERTGNQTVEEEGGLWRVSSYKLRGIMAERHRTLKKALQKANRKEATRHMIGVRKGKHGVAGPQSRARKEKGKQQKNLLIAGRLRQSWGADWKKHKGEREATGCVLQWQGTGIAGRGAEGKSCDERGGLGTSTTKYLNGCLLAKCPYKKKDPGKVGRKKPARSKLAQVFGA